MLYRISVAERGLTGITNIFRSRLNGLDDLLRAGTVPLTDFYSCPLFNLRTAGGLSHLRTAGGGDDRPPQRTRKLRKITTSGKRRWIGRGKFYKNT